MKIIKKILCLGLVALLFLHTNYLAVYYSLYEINTDDLIASCCEKKVDNCNAHCYLDKKMNETDSKDRSGSTLEMKIKVNEFVVTDFIPVLFPEKNNSFNTLYNLRTLKTLCSDIEHPPRS